MFDLVLRGRAALIAVCLAALMIPAPAFAQSVTTGEITGTATDSSGAVVAGASISLKSTETGESRMSISNATGQYRFTFVRPGAYVLDAVSAGLRSGEQHIIVVLGQVTSADLQLKVLEPRQAIEVSAAAPLLQTENADATYTLTQRQMNLLPLPGGDLVAVAYSAPGVVIANRFGSGGSFAIDGIGSSSNLFTLNGADEMDPYYNVNSSGTSGLMLGANEVQEASIITNAYEGQYGRQAGAQVNLISKSGSNAFHGNAVYTYNGSFLNANDFFNNQTGLPRPRTVSNQYAASIGGPIRRDKLFFFVDTEGLRYALPGARSIVTVPSTAFEQYTLSQIQPSQVALYKRAFALYDAAPGRSTAVAVTNGPGPLQDSTNALGCGTFAGTPTGAGGTFGVNVSCADAFATNTPADTAESLTSARIDYNLTARQHLFFRGKIGRGSNVVSTSTVDPIFNAVANVPITEAQVSHAFAISPRVANTFTASLSYHSYFVTFPNYAGAVAAFPFRFNINDGGSNGAFGLAALGAPSKFPTGARTVNLQFIDDVSFSTGRHTLKAGVNYRHTRVTDLQYAAFNIGRFNFNSLGEFAHGALNGSNGSTYFQRFSTTPVVHVRLYTAGVYGQDEWAITPRVKLTAALRFELAGNPSCVEPCFTLLSSPFATIAHGATIPYNQSIRADQPNAFYSVGNPVVQPRLSVAYNPAWSKGTVVRAGFGIFSDLYPEWFADNAVNNPPNVFSPNIRTGLVLENGASSAPGIAAASASAFVNGFASGATLQQVQQAIAPATFAAPFYVSVPSELRMPKFLEWSFEVQQQFGTRNVASVRYSGNHGTGIFVLNQDLNAAVNTRNFPNGFAGMPTTVPDARFGIVQQPDNTGYSNYNGLTFSFRRSLATGFQGQISYTWSHALDIISNGGINTFAYDSAAGLLNPLDLRSNYSSADYDVRHNLVLDFVWTIPAPAHDHAARSLLGGWTLANKTNAHTGTPFSVIDSQLAGRALINAGTSVPILATVIDPAIQRTCDHSAVQTPCFTAAQFATSRSQTTFGNFPRNSFRGPGYFDVDTALYKSITVTERLRMTLGVTAFNMLNHPNFADPTNNVAVPGFGQISTMGVNPGSPYGSYGGPTGRIVVVNGRIAF